MKATIKTRKSATCGPERESEKDFGYSVRDAGVEHVDEP